MTIRREWHGGSRETGCRAIYRVLERVIDINRSIAVGNLLNGRVADVKRVMRGCRKCEGTSP